MNEQEFAELAAGHALHALSPEDAEAFESARRLHPEWEHHLETDAATAALLAGDVAEVAPPAGIREALLAQIAAAPSARHADAGSGASPALHSDRPQSSAPSTPTDQSGAAPRRWGGRSWFALAASVALLVGVGWGAVFVSEQLNTPASVVALDQIESAPDAQSQTAVLDDGGEVTAHWSASVGKAVLVTDGLPALPDDETFELWFVRGEEPISAGTFSTDDGAATALLEGAMEPGDVIAVTVEQAGGSPSGLPTSDPIVAIATA